MAMVVKPGDTQGTPTLPPEGQAGKFTLKQLQEIVGGYIEPIRLGLGLTMLVNEDGIRLGLPHNEGASTISGHRIFGTAVVVHEKEWE